MQLLNIVVLLPSCGNFGNLLVGSLPPFSLLLPPPPSPPTFWTGPISKPSWVPFLRGRQTTCTVFWNENWLLSTPPPACIKGRLTAEELMLLNCGAGEDSRDSLGLQGDPVYPKGDQSWAFIGRTDAEPEAPILWAPNVKSQLIRKDPDAGKDGGQEEKGTTEDEMIGWHLQWTWVWTNSGR